MATRVSPSVLPPGLRGWEELLAFLDDDVVLGLGPLLRALSDVMASDTGQDEPAGEPDGYDGIAVRGSFDQLLMSEWLWADALPDEFIRRFSMSELQYLKSAHRSPLPPGRIVALVDTGPDQLGARRLAQLAAILVLARRAEQRQTELAVGLLSDDADSWLTGSTKSIVKQLLAARTSTLATQGDLTGRLAGLQKQDDVWALTNLVLPEPTLSALVPHRVASTEVAWTDTGASKLALTVDRTGLVLALPSQAVAIRILRGEGFRSPLDNNPVTLANYSGLRFPVFAGVPRRVICRTETTTSIAAFSIPALNEPSAITDRPKRGPRVYHLDGQVLAVYCDSKRVVGLYCSNSVLRVKTFGSKLGKIDTTFIPLPQVELSEEAVDRLAHGPLQTMQFESGDLIVPILNKYVRVSPPNGTFITPAIFAAVTRIVDWPIVAYRYGFGLTMSGGGRLLGFQDDFNRFTVGHECFGASVDGETWSVYSFARGRKSAITPLGAIVLSHGGIVKGIVCIAGVVWLVTVAHGGQIIRLSSEANVVVLTEFSGDVAEVAVHPTEPLIAVQYRDGRIAVVDIEHKRALLKIKADGS
jgi:hypothetical protein